MSNKYNFYELTAFPDVPGIPAGPGVVPGGPCRVVGSEGEESERHM